ncbi:MAG: antibiotic biosynthesis monooxygenase [Micrococcales bacterium]|nr:antibiotic biosynthesis monooxygenase [Micrococcales bacterium]
MANPVVVVATFFPRAGQHDAVHAVIAAAQTDVHQEKGCLLYSLHETDDRFVLIEKWTSAEDLEIHLGTERLGQLVSDLEPLLDSDIEIVQLQPVAHPTGHKAAAL